MRCPFLREAQVKSCRSSPFRTMIVRLPAQKDAERCSSPDYVHCPAARRHHEERPSPDHCPFLQESLVQYCAAISITKYIPYSESLLSPCGTESHRYCEPYLAMADPEAAGSPLTPDHDQTNDSGQEYAVDGIRIPGWLWYAPNHMWLDISADGLLHVGIDAFLARTLGSPDDLTFITTKEAHRPAIAFNVRGVDLQLVFPNLMLITRTNSYLRANLSKISTDPFTLGWLFEGQEPGRPADTHPSSIRNGLISGQEAAAWMRGEVCRMNTRVHDFAAYDQGRTPIAMADGGRPVPGIMQQLDRERILRLFHEFFSPAGN